MSAEGFRITREHEWSFTLCNINRSARFEVLCRCNVADVIRAACAQQNYPQSQEVRLALECNGTIIDEDESLIRWASERLMLLLPGQQWTPYEEMTLCRSPAQLSYSREGFGVFSYGASFNTFLQTPRMLATSYGGRQYVRSEFMMKIILENLRKLRKSLKQKKRTDWQRNTGAFIVFVANCCIWYGAIVSLHWSSGETASKSMLMLPCSCECIAL